MANINKRGRGIKRWHVNLFFNKKYRFVGQLMQGRFRAEIIENDEYFLAISRYIHLNPVKAGLASRAADYPWSSCQDYAAGTQDPLVFTGKTLGYFTEPRIEHYMNFLEQRMVGGANIESSSLSEQLLDEEDWQDRNDEEA